MSENSIGPPDEAREEALRRGVGSYERHIFICTGPDCCTPEEGVAAWERLKSGVAKLNSVSEKGRIYRTKVGCLRICRAGPTPVYDHCGTGSGGPPPDALDVVIMEDLGECRHVEDVRIGEKPL